MTNNLIKSLNNKNPNNSNNNNNSSSINNNNLNNKENKVLKLKENFKLMMMKKMSDHYMNNKNILYNLFLLINSAYIKNSIKIL
mmetsp:Transcript_9369/g.1439  ORF Transcript_9369/g.1439 Transcript_9369/m.1439 type:complete len:84 (+) Transcript_9369:468-719(+)